MKSWPPLAWVSLLSGALSSTYVTAASTCPAGTEQVYRVQDQWVTLCRHPLPGLGSRPFRVSPACLAEDKTAPCTVRSWLEKDQKIRALRLRTFSSPNDPSTDRTGGKNPAALFCTFTGGTPQVAENRSGNQDTLCEAPDGTWIVAWDLFGFFQP